MIIEYVVTPFYDTKQSGRSIQFVIGKNSQHIRGLVERKKSLHLSGIYVEPV